MQITLDLNPYYEVTAAEKAVIKALADFWGSSEQEAAQAPEETPVKDRTPEETPAPSNPAAAREDGAGFRLQKARQEAVEGETGTDEGAPDVDGLREVLENLARRLLDAGQKRAVLDALKISGSRKVSTVPDEKVAEVLEAIRASAEELLPEESESEDADEDAEPEDTEPEDVDDVGADPDEPGDDDEDQAALDAAYKAARATLDRKDRPALVAALGKVGARKVSNLTPDQARELVKILEG